LAVTDPAVAVKVPVVDPAGTVADAGTVKALLLSEIVTEVLAVGARERVTVQVEVALDATVLGEQARLETVMVGATVMVPPVPEPAIELPVPEAAITLLTDTATLALAAAVSFTVIVAATPLPIPAAFMPLATQIMDVVPGTQLSVLPAAVSADPATALTEATSLDAYESIHCSAAGELLPDRDRFRLTELPCVPDPEARLNEAL
jgi:hypothetical protein